MFSSQILETANIQDILKTIQADGLLILDLDNTIIEPHEKHSELGSDQWFGAMLTYASQVVIDSTESASLVIAVYNAVHTQISVQLIDPNVKEVFHQLNQKNIPIIALTARGAEMAKDTLRQLNEINVHFSQEWEDTKFDLPNKRKQPIFQNGIIFCNGIDKGECLDAFFKAFSYRPKQIIMADDKEKYLQSVGKVVNAHGGQFIGYRYGLLDEKVKKFDITNAMLHLSTLESQFPDTTINSMKKLKITALQRNTVFKQDVIVSPAENEEMKNQQSSEDYLNGAFKKIWGYCTLL